MTFNGIYFIGPSLEGCHSNWTMYFISECCAPLRTIFLVMLSSGEALLSLSLPPIDGGTCSSKNSSNTNL